MPPDRHPARAQPLPSPAVISVRPLLNSDWSLTFHTPCSEANGSSEASVTGLQIAPEPSGMAACYVSYYRSGIVSPLLNDAATQWL